MRQKTEAAEKTGFDRLLFFSDAVFAIAITVLVLDFKVPDVPRDNAELELLRALLGLWPRFLGYVISFAVIGLYWVAHHRLFRYIERYDTGLLQLNLLPLLSVAFLPFPTAVLSSYEYTHTAVVFYALSLSLCAIAFAIVWWYATAGRRLVDANLTGRTVRYLMLRILLPLVAFLPAVALSFLSPRLAVALLLLILVLILGFSAVVDQRHLA